MSLPMDADRQGAIPPAVKNAVFIKGDIRSFRRHKLIPSSYLDGSKFSIGMNHLFYHFIFILLGSAGSILCADPIPNTPNCTICLQPLQGEFSVDAWGNTFHSRHENEGVFCFSCSRIISEGVTQGGYIYSDGRHLCSLCQTSVVKEDSVIQNSYRSVLNQLESVGIQNIPRDLSIELVGLDQLNINSGNLAHSHLKGFTKTNLLNKNESPPTRTYQIFLLNGLPKIEFEAVMAHELLHVWIYENKLKLSSFVSEGFCNLGSELIYNNDPTKFSQIHLKALAENNHLNYGDGYLFMKKTLEKAGWNNLLKNLADIEN